VIVVVLLVMVVLIGMIGLAVDVGNFYRAQRQLQAAADAAALAAAGQLPNVSAATAIADEYSASAGGKNAARNLTGVTTNVSTKCISGLPCNPVDSVVVTEQATVPTLFAKILGINSATITAKATAVMGGGIPQPVNVMIVLDRTASMSDPCTAGGTKFTCAKNGVFALLNQMNPSVDKVGLAVFPPPTSLSQTCSSSTSNLGYDNPSKKTTNPNYPYTVVPLSSNYRTSATGPLNTSSALVQTVNCLQAPGGHGTSFATAIEQAQAELAKDGTPKAQNVIILLSDGDANYGPVYYDNPPKSPETSPYRTQPCHQAINSAHTETAAGTWVYAIAYDTNSNSADPYCYGWTKSDPAQTTSKFTAHEAPLITGISTMQQIASDPTKYYYDPTPGDLTVTFQTIATSLTTPILVADNSTNV
jgi:Putative Flp pilus-assembly TadE/G-like/von Willebrand factor type A domain